MLLSKFIHNCKKLYKNINPLIDIAEKKFFRSQSLNNPLSIIDLTAERRVWTFTKNDYGFKQHMWNNRNDLAIRQQFRADSRKTPNTFMDIVTLVRNSWKNKALDFVKLFQMK